MYGMMDNGSWMFGGGFVMLLWWLIPIALVVALAAFFLGRSGRNSPDNNALEILMKRYAQGEIGSEEFGRKKRDLGV